MFELRTLRYFFTFIEEGSITRAAQVLHITEPTLSRQLGALERNVGKPLYRRVNRRIVLTKEGEALFNYAENILSLADQAQEELLSGSSRVTGSVFIGGGSTIGMEIIADAVGIMRQSNPEILTEFIFAAGTDQIADLAKGQLDFVVEEELTRRAGLDRLEFPVRDRWVAFMRADDPLAKKKRVKPKDFVGKNVIVPRRAMKTIYVRNMADTEKNDAITPLPSNEGGVLSSWFGDYLGQINVIATQNISLYGMFFVKKGLAYSFAYEGLYEIEGLVRKPLDPELSDKNGLTWNKRHPLSEQAQVFLDCAREACERRREEKE